MQEQPKRQVIPLKVYRTADRIVIAAPMAGMEPEDIVVEVTAAGHVALQGAQRALLKDVKELLVDEWSIGAYERDYVLPVMVDATHANVTYGNGVVMVSLPISDHVTPGRLTLDRITPTHGEHQGVAGHPGTEAP